MSTPILDLDINAKIPIIRVDGNDWCDNIIDRNCNGIDLKQLLQNGLTNHHDHLNNNHHHSHNNNQNHNHHTNSKNSNKNNHNNNHNNNSNNNNNSKLPKPSFRKTDSADYKKRIHTSAAKRKESYYHYEEPSADDLMNRVEYDMDLEDIQWLNKYNEELNKEHRYNLSENDFEKIMDRLEKVSYFENQTAGTTHVPAVDQDAVCAICNDGDCSDTNVILFCDLCDLAVHQECYGVPYIPEGQWLCRRCLQSPLRNVECELCPNMGGAFKQTDNNGWAHVICALWIPEVCFANTVFLEPIDSLDQIPAARWKLNCYICKEKRKGACIQCNKPNCYVPFHVTCAQQAGLYMKIRTHRYDTDDGGSYTDVKKEAFCDMHTPSDGNLGGGMYSGDDSDEDLDSEAYKKKKQQRKKQIKKTRKILSERREECKKKDTAIKVDEEKRLEISKLLGWRGKKSGPAAEMNTIRQKVVEKVHKYWQLKRDQRSGVPLLRRLQVSYYHNSPRTFDKDNLDADRYTNLRYDLEKCRLLIGEVKKREILKRKIFRLSMDIIDKRLKLYDRENPPD